MKHNDSPLLAENSVPPETANKELFASLYPELGPKFLDYEKARTIFRQIVDMRDRCLEIGMGTALFADQLLNEGYQIDGLEPPGKMLEGLKARLHTFTKYRPKIIETKAQDASYNGEYDFLVSHSGPLFFVNDGKRLYLEGLRDDQIGSVDPRAFHEAFLKKLLAGVAKKSGALLLNIQEDRTDIPLRDSTILFRYNREGEYDLANQSVVKYGRFVNAQTGAVIQDDQATYVPYRRFACSLEQLKEFLATIGEISVEVKSNIWVLLRPLSKI